MKLMSSKAGFSANLYMKIRPMICPFSLIEKHVPKKGIVVDIGCVYGIFSYYLSSQSEDRKVLGIDINKKRILRANQIYQISNNLRFVCSNITDTKIPKADSITAVDILHHIPTKELQSELLKSCFSVLNEGGTIIIKDLDTKPFWKYYWNYIHDFIMTKGEPVLYRSSKEMKSLLSEIGFTLENFNIVKGYPYAHVLYVARKISK